MNYFKKDLLMKIFLIKKCLFFLFCVHKYKLCAENLRKGATQLKVMAGGGIDSEFDPIHSIQFTVAEMEAAVQAAADWDTYVAVHIYNAKGAIRALNAGVKCLDHGHLINEEVIKLLKEKDAWLVPQTFWTTAPPDFWAPGLGTIPPELDLKIKTIQKKKK